MKKIINELKENKEMIFGFLIAVVIIFFLNYFWNYFNLPNKNDFIVFLKSFFDSYGLPVVFISAILESIILIGNYFPGSLVMLLGISFTNGNPLLAIQILVIILSGMFVGLNISYFLGANFLELIIKKLDSSNYANKIKTLIEEKRAYQLFPFFITPAAATLTSTTLGLTKFKYHKFVMLSLFSIIVWNIIWGIVIYHFGMQIFEFITTYATYIIFFIFILIYIFKRQQFSTSLSKHD